MNGLAHGRGDQRNMTLLTIITLGSTLLLGLIFFLFFCWGVKDGQFSNAEEAKYEMFREPEN